MFVFTHPVRGHRARDGVYKKEKQEPGQEKCVREREIERGTLKISTNSTVGAAADLAL